MTSAALAPLRARAPWRVLDGYGRAVQAACRYAAPRSGDELRELLQRAQGEGLTVGFRGAGRSYGDASLNAPGLVFDLQSMARMLQWDPVSGIVNVEPGLTIEGLWRRTLEDGWWPAVVPGTMRPTLGGCLSMNVHGKNNFRVGPIGNHVVDFDLVTPRGDLLFCSREQNADVFHAAIGGLGLLGAFTRLRLQLKRVESGLLRVLPIQARSLGEMFDLFRENVPASDYLVGWMDCLARGSGLGRGVIHRANYVSREEDPVGPGSLHVETQGLPDRLFGMPRSQLWRFMAPFLNNPGAALINALKYHASSRHDRQPFLQSHVAFAFLLDYIPDWRLAYGPQGFIQYQVFLPKDAAQSTLESLLRLCQERGLPSYLGVLKRHRPDPFLLTHAIDGYSLAMDFRVTRRNRVALWSLTEALTERVLDAGGTFYFAKDAVLRPDDVVRAYSRERLDAFAAIKRRLDPDGVLMTDLARRLLPVP